MKSSSLRLAAFLLLFAAVGGFAQTPAPNRATGTTAEVYSPLVPNLRLRDSPVDGKVLRTLGKDESLTALPEAPVAGKVGSTEGTWLKVLSSKGDGGWCFDGFLTASWIGSQTIAGDFLGDGREVQIARTLTLTTWPLPKVIPASDYDKKIAPKLKDSALVELFRRFYRLVGNQYRFPDYDSEQYLYLPDYDDSRLGRFLAELGYSFAVDGPTDAYVANFEFSQNLVMSVAGKVLSTKTYRGNSTSDPYVRSMEVVPRPGFSKPGSFVAISLSDPASDSEVTVTKTRLFAITSAGLVDTGLSSTRTKAEGETVSPQWIFPTDSGGEPDRLLITKGEMGDNSASRYSWDGKAFKLLKP
jgi:hypothetical protein